MCAEVLRRELELSVQSLEQHPCLVPFGAGARRLPEPEQSAGGGRGRYRHRHAVSSVSKQGEGRKGRLPEGKGEDVHSGQIEEQARGVEQQQ